MSDRLSVLPQYLMPKRAMTVFAGHCAGSRTAWWTRNVIPWFIRRYGVDMNEAADSNPANYPTFNAFFTRALKDGVRPLSDAAMVCPVDGSISQFGAISQGRIIQAKGHDYSVRTLLGGTEDELARQLEGGQFATHLPEPARLPPHPHAVRGPLAPDDLCAGRVVLGESDHRARRAGPVRTQRARGLRVRQRVRPVRAGPRRRHDRRQHGDRLARCGEPARCGRGHGPAVALRRSDTWRWTKVPRWAASCSARRS